MIARSREYFFWAAVCGSAVAGGCQPELQKPPSASFARKAEEPDQTGSGATLARATSDGDAASRTTRSTQAAETPATDTESAGTQAADAAHIGAEFGQVDPADLVMPKVLLTDGHAKTCRVKVGDPMPNFRLPDVAGRPHALSDLLGEKLTVVAFWTTANPYALAELADLEPDIAARFGQRGVRVVGINERDRPELARRTVERLGARFPNLLDADGAVLAEVATRKLPRTYLLDSSGKILWFDIEYSNSTRRELREAIQFLLNQG